MIFLATKFHYFVDFFFKEKSSKNCVFPKKNSPLLKVKKIGKKALC